MWTDLTSEVEEMFKRFEGCGLPTVQDVDGRRRARGFGLWNPDDEAEAKREFQREYEKRPARRAALALWRKNNKPKINASARARRAKRKAGRR